MFKYANTNSALRKTILVADRKKRSDCKVCWKKTHFPHIKVMQWHKEIKWLSIMTLITECDRINSTSFDSKHDTNNTWVIFFSWCFHATAAWSIKQACRGWWAVTRVNRSASRNCVACRHVNTWNSPLPWGQADASSCGFWCLGTNLVFGVYFIRLWEHRRVNVPPSSPLRFQPKLRTKHL